MLICKIKALPLQVEVWEVDMNSFLRSAFHSIKWQLESFIYGVYTVINQGKTTSEMYKNLRIKLLLYKLQNTSFYS